MARDKEKQRINNANYRKKHPGFARAWYLAHPGHVRIYQCNNHSITVDYYDHLLAAQNGVCAICKQPESMKQGETIRSLSIDHDHNCCPGSKKSCGKCIRGLLCFKCNRGLGLFQDDAVYLHNAATYLDKPKRAGAVL